MGRVAYVNGRFRPHALAAVHIEDRGYQLADGVYEVWAVFDGALADPEGHFARLARSLGELRIAPPMSEAALRVLLKETLRRNRVRDGLLYLQITRGVAPRDHAFPDPPVRPAVVITARSVDYARAQARADQGVAVVTQPETRWARCDIKSIALLPNVMAKQAAREAGAVEAWFVDDLGLVTDGASSNAWNVDGQGALRTRDIQANILRGVTRASLLDLAAGAGLAVEQRPFTVEEAREAREAFITGAGTLVLPVVGIDGHVLGDGTPGPVAKRLRALYIGSARRATAAGKRQDPTPKSHPCKTDSRIQPVANEKKPNDKRQNLQDTFLNSVRRAKTPLTIFLVNGVKLQGVVSWFDNFCVLLRRDGQAQLVYKHAISTIMPSQPLQLYEPALDEAEDD